MTERRNFLKGLLGGAAASLVVPTPLLWTPEERQAVVDLPPAPGPGEPLPEALGGPGMRPASTGYVMALIPPWSIGRPRGAPSDRWQAYYAEMVTVHMTERFSSGYDTPTFDAPLGNYGLTAPTIELTIEMMPGTRYAHATTAAEAARMVTMTANPYGRV